MSAQPIVEYNEIAMQLDTAREYSNFLPNVTTKEGYEKSKRVSLDIGKLKTALEKTRKEKKAYWLEGGKQVDLKAKEIAAQLDEMQQPHLQAYKELDNIKKEREAQRKAELEERLSNIADLPTLMQDASSDELIGALQSLESETCEEFYEYTADALKARNRSIEMLGEMLVKAKKAEKDAAELAELRKQQALREQQERDERIAQEAAAQAKAEEEEARRQLEESERRHQEEMAAAHERARQKAAEAARAERARYEAEVLAKEEEARQREADRQHRAAIHNEILTKLLTTGITEQQGKDIIALAVKGEAGNLGVTY